MFEQATDRQDASVQNTLLLASVLKVQQTGRAIEVLADAGCVEEIQTIGRTLVEITVNAAYLQASGDKEVERYLRFQPRRVYEQVGMLRSGREGDIAAGVLDKIKSLVVGTGLAKAKENTDPSWTAKSLLERAQISDKASHIPVMDLMVRRCYPRGHGAVHGTVDSLRPFISEVMPSEEAKPGDRQTAMIDALFSVNLCLFSLCTYLNEFFRLSMDEALQDAAATDTAFTELRGQVGEGGKGNALSTRRRGKSIWRSGE